MITFQATLMLIKGSLASNHIHYLVFMDAKCLVCWIQLSFVPSVASIVLFADLDFICFSFAHFQSVPRSKCYQISRSKAWFVSKMYFESSSILENWKAILSRRMVSTMCLSWSIPMLVFGQNRHRYPFRWYTNRTFREIECVLHTWPAIAQVLCPRRPIGAAKILAGNDAMRQR